MTPRSPSSSGVLRLIWPTRPSAHVEGADEVDLDDLAVDVEVVGRGVLAVAADRAAGPADAGTVDDDEQGAASADVAASDSWR